MQLLAVGINHTTAPVSLREKVAFPADRISQAVEAARMVWPLGRRFRP